MCNSMRKNKSNLLLHKLHFSLNIILNFFLRTDCDNLSGIAIVSALLHQLSF